MTGTSASSKPAMCSERVEVPAKRVYQIKRSFAAVHFEQIRKGRIVFLREGAELRVMGSSSLVRDCFEVISEGQVYHIFRTDLLSATRAVGTYA